MNRDYFISELKALAEKCDETPRQQALKSILYSVIGTLYLDDAIIELRHRTSDFAKEARYYIQYGEWMQKG